MFFTPEIEFGDGFAFCFLGREKERSRTGELKTALDAMEAHCREKDEENLTMKKDTQLQIETMVKATEWEKEKLAKQKAEAAERVQRATTR